MCLGLDINQCDSETWYDQDRSGHNVKHAHNKAGHRISSNINSFLDTHKCHNTSKVSCQKINNIYGAIQGYEKGDEGCYFFI